MQRYLEPVGGGLLLPAAVAFALTWLIAKCGGQDFARRRAAAWGTLAATLTGFAILEWEHRWPTSYWHWLPWVAALAAFLGPLGVAPGVLRAERWTLYVLLGLISAWLLVPTWGHLDPPRTWYVLWFAGIIGAVSVLGDLLAVRVSPPLLSICLAISSLGCAALLAVSTVRFAQLAGVVAAAYAGCAAALAIGGRSGGGGADVSPLQGAIPLYAVTVGALALLAQLSQSVPTHSCVLVLAAPLGLWACEWGPLAKWRGAPSVLVRLAAVAIPLAVALWSPLRSFIAGGW